jgi:hypothetical protein
MTLEQICTRIEYYTRGLTAEKHNFEVDGTKYTVEGDKILGAKRSNGKPNPGRKCATLSTEVLYKYARAMGIDPKGKSKTQICKEMQEKKLASRKIRVAQVEAAAPKPEPTKLEKVAQKFEELIGFKNYNKKTFKNWLLSTPHQKKVLVAQLRREHNLEKFLNSIETGPFRNDIRRFAQGKTESQIRNYAESLLREKARLSARGDYTGYAKGETEIM